MTIFLSIFLVSALVLGLLIRFAPEGIEQEGEGFCYSENGEPIETNHGTGLETLHNA